MSEIAWKLEELMLMQIAYTTSLVCQPLKTGSLRECTPWRARPARRPVFANSVTWAASFAVRLTRHIARKRHAAGIEAVPLDPR
jgi:hypothetical protein